MDNYYKLMISVIWGLGISCLFKKICVNNECIVYKAPKNLRSHVERNKNKCYIFEKGEC